MLSEPEIRRLHDDALDRLVEDLAVAGVEPQTIALVRARGAAAITNISASIFRSSSNLQLWNRIILNTGVAIAYENVLAGGGR